MRQRRAEVGLAQGDLARRVGVSRQALSAIESGRQIPSTLLALQLSRALACEVEDLFALPDASLRARLADPGARPHSRLALGRVDGSWAAHPIGPVAQAGDGVLLGPAGDDGRVTVELLGDPRDLERNVLVAGCAPLLGVLAGRLGLRYRDARATWIPANSARALDLLGRGLVHLAGVHLVDVGTPGGHAQIARERLAGAAVLVNLTRWRQGLVVALGNPLGIRDIADVLRPDVRFALRESGAGARALLRSLLREVEGDEDSLDGPVASGHGEVARLVRWGVADAGIAIESAAIAEGLDFVPLSEERFDLLLPEARADDVRVARLLELIRKPAFRSEASRLPGYDLSTAGHASTVGAT